jgi:hypothetical protein
MVIAIMYLRKSKRAVAKFISKFVLGLGFEESPGFHEDQTAG